MSKETVKTQIDLDITNKTTSKSITPSNVGNNMKAVVDLIPDNISKTNGNVDAISGSKATLQYDINTVNKDGGSEVKLPTTTEVGKEVLFLASNYAGTVSVYVNDAEDVKLSGGPNGISGSQGNLQINANEAYRFIYRTNDYWYFEKIIDIPTNYYQLVSERTIDGTLATNSNFKYPTEQAVKTYVDTTIETVTVDTAFVNKIFSSVMSVTHNPNVPNFEIDITGNIDLTVTGTVNGDLGLVNLYFSSTEVATLNGVTDLVITGSGEMIPVYFIHDTDGLKWYQEIEGGLVDTSDLAVKVGTRLYHNINTSYTGTVTNVGVNCTVDFIDLNMVGFMLIKANGETAIVDTITNITTFTTIEPFTTNSTSAITAKARALWLKSDGSLIFYNKEGTAVISLNADLSLNIGNYLTEQTNGHMNMGGAYWKNGQILIDGVGNKIHIPQYAYFSSGVGEAVDTILRRDDAGVWKITDGADILSFLKLKNILPTLTTYANDAAADADTSLPSNGLYKLTGSRIVYQKP